MFDGLLGRGFSAKCKSSIKLLKSRIDVIRRKRNAMLKFLKKDIADLLANNLDSNAYGRAEGLLVELKLSSCYDMVEQFCSSIPQHLKVMQKQSECPQECREAVASLIFAAARFADLLELRDLRQMFTEKYGNSLEPFVSQQFTDKLAPSTPSKEMKLQLMQDIAREYSVKWDSRNLERSKSNPPESAQDRRNRQGSFDDRQKDGNKAHNDWLKSQNSSPGIILKREKEDTSSRGRREPNVEDYKPQNVAVEKAVVKRESHNYLSPRKREELHNDVEIPIQGRREFIDNGFVSHNEVLSRGERREFSDDKDAKFIKSKTSMPGNLAPPPYLRQYGTPNVTSMPEKPREDPPMNKRELNDRSERMNNGFRGENKDNLVNERKQKPKPTSVRRRPLKQPPGNENPTSTENDEVSTSRSSSRKGEEEEKTMKHYSNKPSKYEPSKVKTGLYSKTTLSSQDGDERYESRNAILSNSDSVNRPYRAVSMPPEPVTPTSRTAGQQTTHARAVSLQPTDLAFIHPKLPEYDDLAARIASLQRRG